MGCLLSLILLGISAGIIFLWGVSKTTIIILIVLWIVGFIFTFIFGHRGFGTGNNTDLMILIFVFGISLAIAIPYFHKQKQKVSCNFAKQALIEISEAEKDYFSKYKSFTSDINVLNLKWIQGINISIRADEKSFVATASHNECDINNDKVPDQFTWDSGKSGLQ
jgi:Tfp pilus assembly protein PilE